MDEEDRVCLIKEAVEIARGILAGQIDPNKGCAQIADINAELEWPPELSAFGALAHEQTGHERLGITAESCIPEIMKEAKKLIEKHSQQSAPADRR